MCVFVFVCVYVCVHVCVSIRGCASILLFKGKKSDNKHKIVLLYYLFQSISTIFFLGIVESRERY